VYVFRGTKKCRIISDGSSPDVKPKKLDNLG